MDKNPEKVTEEKVATKPKKEETSKNPEKVTEEKATKKEVAPKKEVVSKTKYKNLSTRNSKMRKELKELQEKTEKLDDENGRLLEFAQMTQEESMNMQKQMDLKTTRAKVYHETMDNLIQSIGLALDSAVKIMNYNAPDEDFKTKKGDE